MRCGTGSVLVPYLFVCVEPSSFDFCFYVKFVRNCDINTVTLQFAPPSLEILSFFYLSFLFRIWSFLTSKKISIHFHGAMAELVTLSQNYFLLFGIKK